MEKIEQWCTVISLLSIISALLLSLLPENDLKKSFRVIASIVIIYAAFNSLYEIKSEIGFLDSFNFENEFSLSSESQDILLEEYEIIIEKAIENKLYENGINIKCESIIYYEGESYIIEKIIIEGELSADEKEAVKIILEDVINNETIIQFKVTE